MTDPKPFDIVVLVTGARDWTDAVRLAGQLDDLHRRYRISALIHGGAHGADTLAGQWAQHNGVCEIVFPYASAYGKDGGPVRNQWMLDWGVPDMLVAFPTPSARGTWDMVQKAKQRGVSVRIVR